MLPDEEREIAIVKVYGNGAIHIPKDVKNILQIQDGDKILFIQSGNRIFINKIHSRRQSVGKYLTK